LAGTFTAAVLRRRQRAAYNEDRLWHCRRCNEENNAAARSRKCAPPLVLAQSPRRSSAQAGPGMFSQSRGTPSSPAIRCRTDSRARAPHAPPCPGSGNRQPAHRGLRASAECRRRLAAARRRAGRASTREWRHKSQPFQGLCASNLVTWRPVQGRRVRRNV